MEVASKKTVKKAQMKGFEFVIDTKDVIERINFGSFEVVKTKRGILYKNYTGYHVWTTPYAVGHDGKAHETSMYMWLDNLINTYYAFKGHEKKKFVEDNDVTKGEIFDTDNIITEVCMSYPMTAFVDIDKATQFAREYMQWLKEKSEKLQETMNKPAPEEDMKAEAIANEERRSGAIVAEM